MGANNVAELGFTAKELRIMVQSLGNCLETCRVHARMAGAPCKDCEAARKLKRKLEQHLTA